MLVISGKVLKNPSQRKLSPMVMQVWRLYGGVWAFMDVLHRALEGLAWLSPAHRPSTPRHSTPQHAAVASAPPSGGASFHTLLDPIIVPS